MYYFGLTSDSLTIDNVLNISREKELSFQSISVEKIIDTLELCQSQWREGSLFYQKAFTYLKESEEYDDREIKSLLSTFYHLLSKEELLKRVLADFKKSDVLDGYTSVDHYDGKIYAKAHGLLLHITAGNVFLGAIDSLLMGILTKNISIVKLSSNNTFIPLLFAKSLSEVDKDFVLCDKFALINWKGGDKAIENTLKNEVDAIITWGGEEMVKSYQENLPARVKLINHGPKISFHVLTKRYVEEHLSYDSIVKDIITFEQKACANSQNIFLEKGIDKNVFAQKLSTAFDKEIKRKTLSRDEYVELIKDAALADYHEFETGDKNILRDDYQILFDHHILNPTALNRSIKIKEFDDSISLSIMLKKFSFYLQTCGLGAIGDELNLYKRHLAYAGVTRVTNIGSMLESLSGSPHDGGFSLMELTRICVDESRADINDFVNSTLKPSDRSRSFSDIIPMGPTEIEKKSLIKSDELLALKDVPGYIFSSGGTSGNPKYAWYSYEEFNQTATLLGKSYLLNGLKRGERVGNLFMAGNMWSSFSAIQKALEYSQAIQFPMGAQMCASEIEKVILGFQIKTLFGLPGLLLDLCNKSPFLKIKKIFYAGESFSESSKVFISDRWGVEEFISAGYASVDVGPIGYQDSSCHGSEHFLFDGLKLEIINEEAVVTSMIRKTMPVIRYRTGDKVELLPSIDGRVKFRLLGRVDQKICIWSARIELSDLATILRHFSIDMFQLILKHETICGQLEEILEIRSAVNEAFYVKILEDLYYNLKDLNETQSFDFFQKRVVLNDEVIEKSHKTGKFKHIIDLR